MASDFGIICNNERKACLQAYTEPILYIIYTYYTYYIPSTDAISSALPSTAITTF